MGYRYLFIYVAICIYILSGQCALSSDTQEAQKLENLNNSITEAFRSIEKWASQGRQGVTEKQITAIDNHINKLTVNTTLQNVIQPDDYTNITLDKHPITYIMFKAFSLENDYLQYKAIKYRYVPAAIQLAQKLLTKLHDAYPQLFTAQYCDTELFAKLLENIIREIWLLPQDKPIDFTKQATHNLWSQLATYCEQSIWHSTRPNGEGTPLEAAIDMYSSPENADVYTTNEIVSVIIQSILQRTNAQYMRVNTLGALFMGIHEYITPENLDAEIVALHFNNINRFVRIMLEQKPQLLTQQLQGSYPTYILAEELETDSSTAEYVQKHEQVTSAVYDILQTIYQHGGFTPFTWIDQNENKTPIQSSEMVQAFYNMANLNENIEQAIIGQMSVKAIEDLIQKLTINKGVKNALRDNKIDNPVLKILDITFYPPRGNIKNYDTNIENITTRIPKSQSILNSLYKQHVSLFSDEMINQQNMAKIISHTLSAYLNLYKQIEDAKDTEGKQNYQEMLDTVDSFWSEVSTFFQNTIWEKPYYREESILSLIFQEMNTSLTTKPILIFLKPLILHVSSDALYPRHVIHILDVNPKNLEQHLHNTVSILNAMLSKNPNLISSNTPISAFTEFINNLEKQNLTHKTQVQDDINTILSLLYTYGKASYFTEHIKEGTKSPVQESKIILNWYIQRTLQQLYQSLSLLNRTIGT